MMIDEYEKKITACLKQITGDMNCLSLYKTDYAMNPIAIKACETLIKNATRLRNLAINLSSYVACNKTSNAIWRESLEPFSEDSLLRRYEYDAETVTLVCDMAPLPSYRVMRTNGEQEYARQLSAELNAIPEDIRESMLDCTGVTLEIVRYYCVKSAKEPYDIDNGAYHALINGLQGVVLKSERVTYLRHLGVTGEAAEENATRIILKSV